MTREDYIKEKIAVRGENMKSFAARIGIPYTTLLSMLKGNIGGAAIDNVIKVCQGLEITVDDLNKVENTDQMNNASPAHTFAESRTLRIPVYGCIAAGIPIEEIEDIDDWEEINYPGAVRGEYIALRIKGDSMEPRICEGDVIIIHIQPTVDNGDLAAVRVNDHYTDGVCATCKKVKFTSDGGIMLMNINPAYEPMYFSRKQIREAGVEIIGKVVELRGKLG